MGQLTDADLTRLCKELTMILPPLPYDMEKGINNLREIILDEDNYKHRYQSKFPTPTNLAVYNETIRDNATNVVQAKAEAIHTAKIADYLLFAAVKR